MKKSRKIPIWSYPIVLTSVIGTSLVIDEATNSRIQSQIFNEAAQKKLYELTSDLTTGLVKSPLGPYDQRLGYSKRHDIRDALTKNGYNLKSQATGNNPLFYDYLSLFPSYSEKPQTGVEIKDSTDDIIYKTQFPRLAYKNIDEIPRLLVESLCLVENREICEKDNAKEKNPAIEWDRFGYAIYGQVLKKIGLPNDGHGGSTLATQLEKLRHSKGGLTNSPVEKLRQMVTASVKSYRQGENTDEEKKRIIVDYINAMPLAGFKGFGEVIGFADGISLWFGADFKAVNDLLSQDQTGLSDDELRPIAKAYRESLTLIMAVKEPSKYLIYDRQATQERLDGFLNILVTNGVITENFKDLVKTEKVDFATATNPKMMNKKPSKAVNTIRNQFMTSLGFTNLQQAELMDISAVTTIDMKVSTDVENLLYEFKDPKSEKSKPLLAYRMAHLDNLDNIDYAFTLYERGLEANLLKVQVDTFKGQFNLNKDAKLELGSTAKLRTLVTYLEVIEDIFQEYRRDMAYNVENMEEKYHAQGALSAWVYDYLSPLEIDADFIAPPKEEKDKTIEDVLKAAMQRKYSGDNQERFFTAGSFHRFHNYKRASNYGTFTVEESIRKSINLPFIRIMRDIVDYTLYHDMDIEPDIFTNKDSKQRKEYLEKFIDRESKVYLWRYWKGLRNKTPEEMAQHLAEKTYKSPVHLTVVYRSVFPYAPYEDVEDFIKTNCKKCDKDKNYNQEYHKYAPDAFNINDKAYITGLHEIQLWLGQFLQESPKASWEDVQEQSEKMRLQSYKWLRRSKNIRGQNKRIKTTIEKEAFDYYIHNRWKKQGFPFKSMVPSYASAIGVSGDNPNSLADLAGILLNNGKKKAKSIFSEISFAKNTPYEDNFVDNYEPAKQVLSPEVAKIAHNAMKDVVKNGTGRRAKNTVVLEDGTVLEVGGKTGTGDNRRQIRHKGGRVESKSINRTATFIFTVGECYYGAIVAYAPKETANDQKFTSALTTQAFKQLVPTLKPLFEKRCEASIKPPVRPNKMIKGKGL